ncbi:hypothetical protein AURANDRAFT_63737 [Aureococcus anophagefferens]|uniref:Uncharacterized protein n=1 Tax=Aureococcus anophagefferens TaxID=44056 RepID=F0Y8Q4_AURAN|nr:hypothetical protein AURANDRAFT_63737 [Aureococcus anophagefferens]EGB08457.1 hypothetical protein AURANDRAFT_63737 [Aureococcus anophagefferens]|eukprot:XP_009036471.1 hypothetical protein AURANDRAFT_63737 [Aureococcus anophagefferens]
MERLADALAARLAAVEDAVAAFLLDPSNQRPHERYGRQPLCYQPEAAAAREPALRLLRAAQTSDARALLDYVAAVASAAYATVPGAAPRPLRADGGTDTPRQPVEPCFAGRPSAAVVREDGWSPRVADVVSRAGALAAKGGDDAFLALRVDARDGRTTYARYVYGALALAAPKFRAAVDAALGPFGAVSHAPLKPSARCRGRRGAPAGDEPAAADVLDALSSAVAVDGHDALERAHAALVARHEAAGPPLDRRRQSSHDAVQRILFEGVVCEVRFALGPARETTSGMAPSNKTSLSRSHRRRFG